MLLSRPAGSVAMVGSACSIEAGSSADALRYMQRRLHRTLPGTHLAIGLWDARPGSELLATLSESKGEVIITSLREAVTLCEALAEQPAVVAEAAGAR